MTSETTTYLAITALVIVITLFALKTFGGSVIELNERTSKAISGAVKR